MTATNEDGTINFFEEAININQNNLVYTESENINIEGTGFGNIKFANNYDFVVNTADQTFRLPLKNGQEGIFADGVKGNGMTLGLTNGTANGGLQTLSYNSGVTDGGTARVDEVGYGKDIGTAGSGGGTGSGFNTYRSVGITTDPSKSGMIVDKTIPSGWNLYYYIGDTLQNARLINVARIEEKLVKFVDKTSTTDRETVVGWGMPDYTAGISFSNNTDYTVPKKRCSNVCY